MSEPSILTTYASIIGGAFSVFFGYYIRRSALRLHNTHSDSIKEMVKMKKLLFMKKVLGFMAEGEASDVHDGILANFSFTGDRSSGDEMDLLGLELEKKATGIKGEILDLAEDARGIDEPLRLFRKTRDLKVKAGNGFIFLGLIISLGFFSFYWFNPFFNASETDYIFYVFAGFVALAGAWTGSRFIASVQREKGFKKMMEEWESKYEIDSRVLDDLVLYLLEQSKVFRDLAKIISYRYPELTVLEEVCIKLAEVWANLGKYVESRT